MGVDTEALSGFVVRLRDSVSNLTLGSGFWLTESYLVTAAHVVGERKDVVLESPCVVEGESVPRTRTGRVVVRSGRPGVAGQLWPYPDLALVRVEVRLNDSRDRRFAPLSAAFEPSGKRLTGDELISWGYARREEGREPPGSPATFRYEGFQGDGFLTIKQGQAAPGISGAPLVCSRTQLVVGVVTATRDATSDLGGFASAVEAFGKPELFESKADVDVPRLFEQILQENQRLFFRDRSGWLRVFPVVSPGRVVPQPWAPFVKTRRSDPSDLLRPDFGVIDYLFRDSEIERQRTEWCDSSQPIAVLVVRGPGGAGKTRFGIQMCREMQRHNWLSGWLPSDVGELAETQTARLLVVDYAEAADPAPLRDSITRLAGSATALAPVRLVLLTRTQVSGLTDPLRTLVHSAGAPIINVLQTGTDAKEATAPLTMVQRQRLFSSAIQKFAEAWEVPPVEDNLILSDERYRWPIQVLFEALDRVLAGDSTGAPSNRPPVIGVYAHEEKHWDVQLPAVDPVLRRWVAAASTIAGAASEEQAHRLLGLHPYLRSEQRARSLLIEWWRQAITGPNYLNPLQPDRLGEYAAVVALTQDYSPAESFTLLQGVLLSLAETQAVAALDLLARACPAYPDLEQLAMIVLQASFSSLVERAIAVSHRASAGEGGRALGSALLRLLTPEMGGELLYVTPVQDEITNSVNWKSCAKLGRFAIASGRVHTGRKLLEKAIELLQAERTESGSYLQSSEAEMSLSFDLGELERQSQRFDIAMGLYTNTWKLGEEILVQSSGQSEIERLMLMAEARQGLLRVDSGQVDRGRSDLLRVLRRMQSIKVDAGTAAAVELNIAEIRTQLGEVSEKAVDLADAAQEVRALVQEAKFQLEIQPGKENFERVISLGQRFLVGLSQRSSSSEAVGMVAKLDDLGLLRMLRRLIASDPDHIGIAFELAAREFGAAEEDVDSGLVADALKAYARVVDESEKAVRVDPLHVGFHGLQKRAEVRIGELLNRGFVVGDSDSGALDGETAVIMGLRDRFAHTIQDDRRPAIISRILEPLATLHRHSHPKADVALLQRAYELAKAAHAGQRRRSGDPYVDHPLAVGTILAGLGMDTVTIVAALLHDVVGDAGVSVESISVEFGPGAAHIVEGVTRIDRIQFGADAQAEIIQKMIVAMARDPRILVVKLADRLHNMRTLRALPPDKQERKARETLEVLAPLAHRLGLSGIQAELEDLAFAVLYPRRYEEVARLVGERFPEPQEFLVQVTEQIKEQLAGAKVNATVVGRIKPLYSVYRKMVVLGRDFSEMQDLIGIRILVESVRDCYASLGIMHAHWQPVPGRFKDFVAMPRFNMYQSLHTVVIGPQGRAFELQIRTHDMHQTAEYGIAAHRKHSEGTKGGVTNARVTGESDGDMLWLRQLLDWQREAQEPGEFLETLRYDLGPQEVFVFTPKGDVISLPGESTPVDFAFAVHTEVGYRCIGARVNGSLVSLDSTLANGDVIEVFTSKSPTAGPSREWLEFVGSRRARTKIRQWFTKERREDAVDAGKEALTKAMRKAGLPLQRLMGGDALATLAADLHHPDVSALYAAVGENQVSASSVVEKLLVALGGSEGAAEDIAETAIPTRRPVTRTASGDPGIVVTDMTDVWAKLAKCCTPVPGDDILGFVTRGGGVSVHRTDCTNADDLQRKPERLVEVSWATQPGAVFLVAIQVEALDRHRLLSDVTKALADERVNILSASVQTSRDRVAISRFTFELADPAHLGAVLQTVRNVDGVFDVERITE